MYCKICCNLTGSVGVRGLSNGLRYPRDHRQLE